MIKIRRTAFIRLISFFVAIAAVLVAFLVQNYNTAKAAKQALQYSYLRSVTDLSLSLDNIKNTLNKGMYCNSTDMMSELSAKLWNDASNAKVSISQLPMEELNLENTYKFLSQVGNYAKSLSEKVANGDVLTQEEKDNITTLFSYASDISQSMWNVESQIHGGYLTFDRVQNAALSTANSENTSSPQHVTNGFAEIESGFSNYPTLIYDGPFSDHIMQKEPLMLKGQGEVSEEEALRKAVNVSGNSRLRLTSEEKGNMPSYVFSAANTTVSITKSGGFFNYMLNYREVGDETISVDKAISIAENYLKNLGVTELTHTYYETQHGMCIINFAGVQGDVTLYTDLIKVGVAMDNGEVLSYDARGYLTNHTERALDTPALTKYEAANQLSPYLSIKESRLCVIPSSGMSERYCYEFHCTNGEGQQILVYINADTAREEQLLILQINENGMLTV